MIHIEIPETKKYFYFPENLGECDGTQFRRIAKLMLDLNAGAISYADFRVLAVYVLLNMKGKKTTFKTEGFIPEADQVKWENIYRLSEFVDHFFDKNTDDDGKEQISVKQTFIHNHSPKVSFLRNYYGPETGFENVTFGQYLDSLEEFIYFSQTGEVQALRNLFAILYLRKNEKYDRRASLKRAKGIFKYLDAGYLYGCYIFFSAIQQYIMGGSVTVMGQELDLSIIFKEVKTEELKSIIPGTGWISTAQDLAESGVFGNYNQVRETEMWPILLRLYELKKRAFDDKEREDADKAKANAKSKRQ